MFSRSTWYSSIGFPEQRFRDRFRQQGLPDCICALTGTCDAAIAQWIGQRLGKQNQSPDFVGASAAAAVAEEAQRSMDPMGSYAITTRFRVRHGIAGIAQVVYRFPDGHLGIARLSAVFSGESKWPLHAYDDAARGRDGGMHCSCHFDTQRASYAGLAGHGERYGVCGGPTERHFSTESCQWVAAMCDTTLHLLCGLWLGRSHCGNGGANMAGHFDRTL